MAHFFCISMAIFKPKVGICAIVSLIYYNYFFKHQRDIFLSNEWVRKSRWFKYYLSSKGDTHNITLQTIENEQCSLGAQKMLKVV